MTQEEGARVIRSVAALSSSYERGSFWRRLRQSSDGRSNAFGRDLGSIGDFFDRHLWNYDANDPYINYRTDTTRLDHVGRMGMSLVSATPVLGDLIATVR